MSQKYEVVLLSPSEFKKVAASNPKYRNVDDTNLGFSDPAQGKAYVLNTRVHELNKYLINHEFEHLLEEDGTHEDEHGVRHKKVFKELIAPALPFASMLLPFPFNIAAGAATGGLNAGLKSGGKPGSILGGAVTGGLTGGAGSILKGLSTAGGALPKILPSFGGGAGGEIASKIGGQKSPLSSFGIDKLLGSGPGGTPPFNPNPSGGVAAGGGGFLDGLKGIFGGGGGSSGGSGGFDLAKLGLGAGLVGLGQFGGPKTPTVPNFSNIPSIANLRNSAGQPLSDIGKLGTQRLTERLGQTSAQLDPAIEGQIQRIFKQERDNVTSQFKAYRPGANLAEDSAYRSALSDVDQRESESIAQAKQAEINRFTTQQAQDISTALGVDTQTLQTLTQLAQLDVNQIMIQLGMDAQQASEFKQQFGRLGEIFVSSGLGLNKAA